MGLALKAYVDLGSTIVEVDVTLGFVEAVEELMAHGKASAIKKLKKWVDPPEAVDDPAVLIKILKDVMPKVRDELRRVPRSASSGLTPNVKTASASLKYALGQKGVPPSEAEKMPIEEVVDFLVILATEAEEIKRSARAKPRL